MKIRNDELKKLPRIAEGGEGVIYEYDACNIIKVYKNCVNLRSKEKKVSLLMQTDLPKEVIKPVEAAYDGKGKFIGFIMKRALGEEIRVLTNRKHLAANGISTKDILDILAKVQEVVKAVHKAGVYIGDLNDQNILFDSSRNVYFIDCDSWSIGTEKCEVVMDLYRDPLMKGNDFSESTDIYAESILIWKTLTRIHPHGGTMNPDMKIMERMRNGISIIDNPKVKIPRTIKPWNNLSPALVLSLKEVFENRSRTLGGELADMCANLKYCDKDKEYYYGKFNKCPLCDSSASIVTKPVSQGVMSGLTLYALLKENDAAVVLSEKCYINNSGMVADMDCHEHAVYQRGRFYDFLDVPGKGTLLVVTSEDRISFSTDRQYYIQKKYRSPIYAEGDSVYYISPSDAFTRMTVTENGNGVETVAECSYEVYFSVDDGHFCLVNKYDGNLIVNCDGRNVELAYPDKIINYGIRRDNVSGNWLVVLENGSGLFKTLIIGKKVEYETEQIRYAGGLGNLCISNNAIYIPIDGKIRGYSYQKQAFKDFECGIVTPDSRLIKNGSAFTIVNDDNVYRLGR